MEFIFWPSSSHYWLVYVLLVSKPLCILISDGKLIPYVTQRGDDTEFNFCRLHLALFFCKTRNSMNFNTVQLKCDGTRWRTGGEVKGKLANGGVANTLHTTSERGVSSITTADAHMSAASNRLNWRPRRFKWTRPFLRKTKSGFCACAITFQTQSTIGLFTYKSHFAFPFSKYFHCALSPPQDKAKTHTKSRLREISTRLWTNSGYRKTQMSVWDMGSDVL
jgi:hypothetical protein